MKRFLILVCILLSLSLVLVGCGGDGVKEVGEDQDSGAVSSSVNGGGTGTTDTSVGTGTTDTSADTTGSSTTDTSVNEVVDCQHVCGEWETVVAPTCVKKGSQKTKCTLCGDTVYCDMPAMGHTEEIIEGREPSCAEVGLTQGKKCATCGKTLESQGEIAKLPHAEEVVAGYNATCEGAGLTEGRKCSVCDAVTVAQEEIPALGHEYVHDFCKVCRAQDPNAKPQADQSITIATGGVSDYVVVYDDKDVRVTEFTEKFIAYMADTHRITLESVPYSRGTSNAHCIYVGDLPETERVQARLNPYNDFGACVSGDDYVLFATDGRLYEYLFELLAEKVLYVIRSGNWTTNTGRNFIYHNTEYADISYVDYVIEKNGGKLTQNVLLKFFEDRKFVAEDGTELVYRLYVPYGYDETKEYPVLVFMHGAGERGNDNLGNMKHMPLKWFSYENSPFWDCIVIAPQCPNGQQWVDTPWADGGYRLENVPESNELRAAMEIIDMVEASFPTDLDRYYVTGLSMGGFATWDMIMRYPDRFAAAVPLCGGSDYKQAYKLLDMPIYTIHGTNDYDVPMTGTKEMVVALEMLGSTVIHYEELKGYPHNIWGYAADKPEIWTWLFEQTREGR